MYIPSIVIVIVLETLSDNEEKEVKHGTHTRTNSRSPSQASEVATAFNKGRTLLVEGILSQEEEEKNVKNNYGCIIGSKSQDF